MTKDERYFISGGLLRLATTVVVAAILFAVSRFSQECFAFGDPNVIAEFRVGPPGNWLLLPVTIGGKSYPFVLDTGSSTSIFDVSLRALLGRPTKPLGVLTVTGVQELDRYATPPMRVGAISVAPGDAFCLDFRQDALTVGEDTFGMLGQDFLRDKVFRIDFDRSRVEFLDRLGTPRGERLPLVWKLGVPFVILDVAVVGKEDFLIDTGAMGFESGAIRERLFERLLAASELRELAKRRTATVSPAGTVHARRARLRQLRVGRFAHQGLIFRDANVSSIALDYLSRYVVTFDLAHSAIYLEPGRGYQHQDRCHLADFTIINSDGKTMIWALERQADGVTAPSGVRIADEVISVDDLQAATSPIFELQRLLCTPGERKIRFKRLDEVRELSITLKEPDELPPPSLRPKR